VIEYDATINGVITAADPAHRKFTLLGQTIRIEPGTTLQEHVKLEPGERVSVFANRRGLELAAGQRLIREERLDDAAGQFFDGAGAVSY